MGYCFRGWSTTRDTSVTGCGNALLSFQFGSNALFSLFPQTKYHPSLPWLLLDFVRLRTYSASTLLSWWSDAYIKLKQLAAALLDVWHHWQAVVVNARDLTPSLDAAAWSRSDLFIMGASTTCPAFCPLLSNIFRSTSFPKENPFFL